MRADARGSDRSWTTGSASRSDQTGRRVPLRRVAWWQHAAMDQQSRPAEQASPYRPGSAAAEGQAESRVESQAESRADTHEAPEGDRVPLDLLVWDAPNVDMTLSNVIGARPSPASRPRFDAVARWLVSAAGDRDVEGAVFANVPPGAATGMRGWIEALRSFGYAVFAKPKLHPEDDVDLDMLRHIVDRARSNRLVRLGGARGGRRNLPAPPGGTGRARTGWCGWWSPVATAATSWPRWRTWRGPART